MIQLATQFSDFGIEGVDFCILAVKVRFQLIGPQLSVVCHLLPLVDQLADIIQEGSVFLFAQRDQRDQSAIADEWRENRGPVYE